MKEREVVFSEEHKQGEAVSQKTAECPPQVSQDKVGSTDLLILQRLDLGKC
jgi:hypothetical protein